MSRVRATIIKNAALLGHSIVLFLLCASNLLLFMIVMTKIGIGDLNTTNNTFFIVFPVLSVVSIFLIVCLFIIKLLKIRVSDLGWTRREIEKNILVGALGFVLISASLFVPLIGLGFLKLDDVLAAQYRYGFDMRLMFLFIGIHAAVLEESVFRGHLQTLLQKKIGPVWGVILGAAIFSLYHLNFNPVGLAGKFILGLGFGLLWYRQKSLVAPATAHILFWVIWGAV